MIMRALVFTGPGEAEVREVPEPVAGAGQVVVDVERAGVCGTDVELFTGEMSYLHNGRSSYPLRPGHEWAGIVTATGAGVDGSWLGRRVTGDTMIACGDCRRCRSGRHHVCARMRELGIADGLPGALAEKLAFPAAYLQALPDGMDATVGALVEPGGNAQRAVAAAALEPGERLLVLGTGTIGLLAALIARSRGIEVHLLGQHLDFARSLGFDQSWTRETLPGLEWDAVVDATNAPAMPGLAVELVEPGRRVVYIGLSGTPSTVDSRDIVLKDVTAVGILGASAGLADAVSAYASGNVNPQALVAAVTGLDDVAGVLAGNRPVGAGAGPKILVDPRR
ncbi:threonine dehydrogenase-like Zn-dependent dehydrogenase [Actinoplanes lutulentus]|uniref:Threonine dehydrogenase-like Zn-dependent dehydrogenase n=1 Tax=Actinoplanes lutulentus TaxID=1287878 RepID=A0A327Z8R8_9ACTN|nr:alcohol dehydrogenase catalytic domain-containing protein [Actinoplanes lutulentus]MBB2948420.1 threonine dehydrogenase-like Zn-dependent dehydrogenase [Actinoplanes lutulentus]RAK34547.1 threonine dehydrogenase-like Zn-dependent dehydrogenase [Actinoplanes lutulentus]